MEFVGASMKSVLVKLEGLPSQEHHLLIRDVCSDDVQWIKGVLASADASFLCSQDDEQSEQRMTWVRKMRDVAYDTEDFVDRIRLQLSRWPEPVGGSVVCAICRALYMISTLQVRYSLAAEIRGLRSRVQDLCVEGCNWRGLDNQQLLVNSTDGATTSYHVSEIWRPAPLITEPVGIEQALDNVSSWFAGVEQDLELRIFTIVGCGGLGKTTLARALLCKFCKDFDSQATVLATWEFNSGAFLRSLLKQIMPPFDYNDLQLGGPGWKDEELREKVEEQFLDKRYIVIVDDVWDVSSWNIIREFFPENDMGSRIVVTTRFNSVAQAISHQQCCVYTLKPLSADDSHCLLQRILGDNHLFPCGTDCPTSRILKKCGGIPLAIVAVAGLLITRLASGSNLITACGSVTSDVENGCAHVENTENILNLCYNDLPADLKTSFLSLSMFPVGSTISRKRLIRRWTTEGFITEKHGKTVEQVAEESFSELIRRNLIQAVEVCSSGDVKSFQVHDVILENILVKSSEENFVNIVTSYSPGPELVGNKVRWLAIHKSSNPLSPKEVMKNMNLLHIRSLTALGTMNHLKYFALMQVLDLEDCRYLDTDHLTMICKMYLLKYLSLRRTYIMALPSRICRLQYLETLDIRETNVRRLPRSICRLKRMVHLLSGDKSRRLALEFTQEIINMSKLKTLSGIKVNSTSALALKDMDILTNLNKLSIYTNVNPKFLLHSPALTSIAIDDEFTGHLDDLVSFSAPFNHLSTLKLSGKLPKLPHWLSRMHFLEELTLSLTLLRTDCLELVSRLPMLYYLAFSVDTEKQCPQLLVILQENASKSGGEIFIPAGGFYCLRTLCISSTALPMLSFLHGSVPALQRLDLRFKMFDGVYGLENLASLKKLHIEVSKQASLVTTEKVKQIYRSVNNHPSRPIIICDEYHEWY